MPDQQTRDIAVAADTKIDAHMLECVAMRIRIEDALKEIRTDVKRINWLLPLIIGGIIAAAHGLDWFFGLIR